jgi:hypothetical protein
VATTGVPVVEAQLAADQDHLHVTWLTDQGAVVHLRLRSRIAAASAPTISPTRSPASDALRTLTGGVG